MSKKITQLAQGNPALDDIMPFVRDPSGVPVTLRATYRSILGLVVASTDAPYPTRETAVAAIIPAVASRVVINRYDDNSRLAPATYRATNVLEWNTYPARLKFTDAGERFWVIAEKVVDVSMAGAVGDGLSIDHEPLIDCGHFFNLGDVGFDVHVGSGTYLWYGGMPTPQKSGTWSGDGPNTSILKAKLDPAAGLSGDPNTHCHATMWQRPAGQPQLDYIEFKGLGFEGDWGGADHTDTSKMNNGVGGRGQVFSLRNYTVVRVTDCTSDWSRRQAYVTRNCLYTYWHKTKALHCGQSGINTQSALVTILTNCDLRWNGDDGLNAAFDAAVVDGLNASGMIMVVGNRFDQVLKQRYGASNHVLFANNVMTFTRTGAISSTSNGDSIPNHSLVVTGNIIRNVVDLTLIEPDAANNAQALVLSQSKLPSVGTGANTVAAVPGIPDGSGNIISPYEYLIRMGVAFPAPGQMGVICSDNQIGRTVAPVAAFSEYGLGLWWTKDGWIDPPFTLSELQDTQHVGISVGTVGRNVTISNNQIDGTYIPLQFTSRVLEGANQNIRVFDNLLTNYTRYGVEQQGTNHIDLEISRNTFDGDPDRAHARHVADGTWDSASVPTGCVGILGAAPGMKVRDNTFRNLNVVHQVNAATVFERNTLECEPVAIGSASNKGIRVIPRAGPEFRYIIKGSNPSVPATWNTTLNHCPLSASAMPSSGFWVEGSYVENTAPAAIHGEFIHGWLRLTTGSGNVADVDWYAMYGVTSSLGNDRYALKDKHSIPAYLGYLQGTAVLDPVGGINMPSVSLPDAATSGAFFVMPYQRNWNNGTIARLKVRYTNIGIVANYFCRLRMRALNDGGGIGNWVFDQTFTLPAAATTNVYTLQTLTVGLDFDKGQGLAILFEREGANVADTATNAMKLINLSFEFESDTPTAGVFDLPIA